MAFLCAGGMAGSSLEAARQTAESDRDPTAQAWSASFGSLYLLARNALLDMGSAAVK
jgi:hypothetical protein